MASNYVLTPQADADLTEIFLYTSHTWGAAQAEDYLLSLDSIMCRLAEGEIKGKECTLLLPEKGGDLYYYHTQRHYIIYRNRAKRLEIIALYHDRMDLPRHLEQLQKN